MRAFTHLSVCGQVLVRDSMEKAKTAVEAPCISIGKL
jgi:hypothetical protein